MTKTIYEDPVVAGIHTIRQTLLDECCGDIDAYRKRVREQQNLSGRRIITEPFRERKEQCDEPEP